MFNRSYDFFKVNLSIVSSLVSMLIEHFKQLNRLFRNRNDNWREILFSFLYGGAWMGAVAYTRRGQGGGHAPPWTIWGGDPPPGPHIKYRKWSFRALRFLSTAVFFLLRNLSHTVLVSTAMAQWWVRREGEVMGRYYEKGRGQGVS